tara:strand:- start:11394 stop:11501 length:108 start_codon:yes stop_codon:yes gene_type:complete
MLRLLIVDKFYMLIGVYYNLKYNSMMGNKILIFEK